MVVRRISLIPAVVAVLASTLWAMPVGPAAAVVDDDNPSVGWRPGNGLAYSMARVGNMIVFGGTFTYMRSPDGASTATRNHLAAIDATTGALLPWNPAPNGTDVRGVAGSPDGSTVYIGGQFSSVGGASRADVAAISASTGSATSFVANTSAGFVRNVRVIGNSLFIVGDFGRLNGSDRGHGAAVDLTTGALRPWNPRTNKGINSIAQAADGSGIFVGGYFTTASGAAREFVAKTDGTSGAVQPWLSGSTCQDAGNPCWVYDVHPTADTVYLGQGGPGGRVAALNPSTGTQRWWSGTDGDVTSVLYRNGKIYVGGHFDVSFNGSPRAGIVVLNSATGAVLPDFDVPVLGGAGVWQLMLDGDALRACGQFSTVGGQSIGRYTTFQILPDPPDTQAPQRPGTFRVPTALSDNVSMSWAPAGDDVATVLYRVYRDGVQIGTSNTTNYKDRAVSPGARYTYTVDAVDAAGNASPASSAVTVTTEHAAPRLLERGAEWSFLSFGNPPEAGWLNPGFVETGWGQGRGEFGFGDADEDSPISPRGVAHYFRTSFNVADVSQIESATMRVLLDDGAVLYLNGQEIARINMPAGTITNGSTAVNGIGGTGEMTYHSVNIPVGRFRQGANLLATSVHNQSTGSSDVSFDAFVTYVPKAGPQPPGTVGGLQGTPTETEVALTWNTTPNADSYTVRRDGVVVGQPTAPSFTDTGLTASTEYRYTVRAENSTGPGPWSSELVVTTPGPPPPAPDAPTNLRVTSVTSSQVNLAWDAAATANSYVVSRDGQDLPSVTGTTFTDTGLAPATTYSYTVRARNAGGTSPASDQVQATTDSAPITTYVAAGSSWRYLDGGAVAPQNWAASGFDASAWKSGNAQFGYGDGDEATLLNWGSNANGKPITYYARTTFDAGASIADITGLNLRAIVDDGAVVYLNGQEIWRYNLPAGAITSTTRASTAIAGTAESQWRTASIPTAALQPGINVLAVEVHNDAPSSSDISLDVELLPVR